ncbi:MAG: substrate-binding domain-containing protein [Pseudomonadota bacterium]
MRLIAAFCLFVAAGATSAGSLRLAATTSFDNSGLADWLIPEAEIATGIEIELLIVGTGAALRLAERGDVDAVLVHAPQQEAELVEAGYGAHRREIMYNDFVIIGPKTDPAEVGAARSAREAFARVSSVSAEFVSRGDESGTHAKELSLWEATPGGWWYLEAGAGMGAALNIAAAKGAYLLSDRASWLAFGNKRDLALLFEGDPELRNQSSFVPVNPDRHRHVDATAARTFEDYLTSEVGQARIAAFAIDGEKLFTPNAR